MFHEMLATLKKQSRLIALIAVCFVTSLLVGIATAKWASESLVSQIAGHHAATGEQVEMIFGRFRESVREGELAVSMLHHWDHI